MITGTNALDGVLIVSNYQAEGLKLSKHFKTCCVFPFFFSSRRRHTRSLCDWSSDVCSSDLARSVISGSSATLQGALYFPTTQLTFSGGSSVTPEDVAIVAYGITFSGATFVNAKDRKSVV